MTSMAAGDRSPAKTFHAITHVWGREYLDMFLNVCIPNQLAPGNMPALPAGSRYRILTRSMHVDELDAHPMVHALRAVIPVDVVVVDELDRFPNGAYGHTLQIACHQRAMADAVEANAAIIMLSADFVFSENALAAVVQRHREGYRAVVNTGLRLRKEPFLQVLQEERPQLAALSSRELVRMALPHLHPHEESMFADAEAFSSYPVAVYWRIGSRGLLARCFHLHPLMVDPMRDIPLVGTNDGHYLASACPDFSRVHVVTDSDELQMFEMTTVRREFLKLGHGGASAWQAAMIAAKCDDLQLRHWQEYEIRLHTDDFDEEWTVAARAAERFAGRVMHRRPFSKSVRRLRRTIGDIEKRRARYAKAWRRRTRRLRPERLGRSIGRRMERWQRRRPRIRLKSIQRPLKLWAHRAGKAVSFKRLRRRLRLFPTTHS